MTVSSAWLVLVSSLIVTQTTKEDVPAKLIPPKQPKNVIVEMEDWVKFKRDMKPEESKVKRTAIEKIVLDDPTKNKVTIHIRGKSEPIPATLVENLVIYEEKDGVRDPLNYRQEDFKKWTLQIYSQAPTLPQPHTVAYQPCAIIPFPPAPAYYYVVPLGYHVRWVWP